MPLPDGYILRVFDEIDGTNDEALRSGCPPGLVVMAASQSDGRGRGRRIWQSPRGNLYITICVKPVTVRDAGQLAFVAGLGVLDALTELVPNTNFALKWPNDVLCKGRKLSGVLIEAGEGDGFATGIGINLSDAPPEDETRFPATNVLAVSGRAITPETAAQVLCRHFDRWYRLWQADGFEPLRAAWLASAHGIGDTIAASTGSGQVEGRFEDLDCNGALILVDGGGDRHAIAAGDMFFPSTD